MDNDISKRLRQLNIEDKIWLVYFFLIFLSIVSNNYERDYFINKDEKSKEKYRKLIILIFSIAILVYLYYFYDSYQAYKELKFNDNLKKKQLTKYSLTGSSLILIAGMIFLYIAVEDIDIETEVAFN